MWNNNTFISSSAVPDASEMGYALNGKTLLPTGANSIHTEALFKNGDKTQFDSFVSPHSIHSVNVNIKIQQVKGY